MKKILIVICCFCLFVNISFAFDPYADEEQETRSKSKLYWGIFMTLVGGFLTYDGFSQEEVDISKPSVDYGGVIQGGWIQNDSAAPYMFTLRSGKSVEDGVTVQNNIIYNSGNVDLRNVNVQVRYRTAAGDYISINSSGGTTKDYRTVTSGVIENLGVSESSSWYDDSLGDAYGQDTPLCPGGEQRDKINYFQENALKLVDVKIKYEYDHKYKKQNKSDIEGVAGLMVATAGIYFIVDYFMDLHKFNQYMKRNDINIRLANAPNEYKLLFQKRL